MLLKIYSSNSICLEYFIRTGIITKRGHFKSMNSLLSLTVQHQKDILFNVIVKTHTHIQKKKENIQKKIYKLMEDKRTIFIIFRRELTSRLKLLF